MANIELVVNIPEEIYKASQIMNVKHEDVIQIPLEVIKNGIPLDDNTIIVLEDGTVGADKIKKHCLKVKE